MRETPVGHVLIATLVLALGLGTVPQGAVDEATTAVDERTIRCESRNYRYRYCPANTENRASLVSQVSPFARCELGRTWGYDSRGVWVDRGCAGEFRVGKGGGGSGAAVAVGAVAGAAVLAAILANRGHDKHRDEVPSWAVGTFRGYDERERTELEVRITPSGSAEGMASGTRFAGTWTRERLELSRYRFRITRAGNGFNAVDESDANHRIYFTPASSGWGQ
jgi:hypothetical protein